MAEDVRSFIDHLTRERDRYRDALERTEAALALAVEYLGIGAPAANRQEPAGGSGAAGTPDVNGSRVTKSSTKLVAAVFRTSDAIYNAEQMLAELTRRGWQTNADNPIDAVRTALARSVKSGVAQRVAGRQGYYRSTRPDAQPSAVDMESAGYDPTAAPLRPFVPGVIIRGVSDAVDTTAGVTIGS